MIGKLRILVQIIFLPQYVCSYKIEVPETDTIRHFGRCLVHLADKNFEPRRRFEMITIISPTNLSSDTEQIHSRIIQYVSLREGWPIEITNGSRTNFQSYKKCRNCPLIDNETPDYR